MDDTVVVALIALPTSIVTAGSVFVSAWRMSRSSQANHEETSESLTNIHVLVNDRLDVALKRIADLEFALRKHGIGLPKAGE